MLECLGSSPSSTPDSSFLPMHTHGRQQVRIPSPTWETQTEFPVPGSSPGSAPGITGIWEVTQQMGASSVLQISKHFLQ